MEFRRVLFRSRYQARADAECASALLVSSAQQAITPTMLRKFASTARRRIRLEGGGYRRDHLRALAQRVEVDKGEVRIMGSKSNLQIGRASCRERVCQYV